MDLTEPETAKLREDYWNKAQTLLINTQGSASKGLRRSYFNRGDEDDEEFNGQTFGADSSPLPQGTDIMKCQISAKQFKDCLSCHFLRGLTLLNILVVSSPQMKQLEVSLLNAHTISQLRLFDILPSHYRVHKLLKSFARPHFELQEDLSLSRMSQLYQVKSSKFTEKTALMNPSRDHSPPREYQGSDTMQGAGTSKTHQPAYRGEMPNSQAYSKTDIFVSRDYQLGSPDSHFQGPAYFPPQQMPTYSQMLPHPNINTMNSPTMQNLFPSNKPGGEKKQIIRKLRAQTAGFSQKKSEGYTVSNSGYGHSNSRENQNSSGNMGGTFIYGFRHNHFTGIYKNAESGANLNVKSHLGLAKGEVLEDEAIIAGAATAARPQRHTGGMVSKMGKPLEGEEKPRATHKTYKRMTYIEKLEKYNRQICGAVGVGAGLGTGTRYDTEALNIQSTARLDPKVNIEDIDEKNPDFDLFTPQIMKLKREFNEKRKKKDFLSKNCKFINKTKIHQIISKSLVDKQRKQQNQQNTKKLKSINLRPAFNERLVGDPNFGNSFQTNPDPALGSFHSQEPEAPGSKSSAQIYVQRKPIYNLRPQELLNFIPIKYTRASGGVSPVVQHIPESQLSFENNNQTYQRLVECDVNNCEQCKLGKHQIIQRAQYDYQGSSQAGNNTSSNNPMAEYGDVSQNTMFFNQVPSNPAMTNNSKTREDPCGPSYDPNSIDTFSAHDDRSQKFNTPNLIHPIIPTSQIPQVCDSQPSGSARPITQPTTAQWMNQQHPTFNPSPDKSPTPLPNDDSPEALQQLIIQYPAGYSNEQAIAAPGFMNQKASAFRVAEKQQAYQPRINRGSPQMQQVAVKANQPQRPPVKNRINVDIVNLFQSNKKKARENLEEPRGPFSQPRIHGGFDKPKIPVSKTPLATGPTLLPAMMAGKVGDSQNLVCFDEPSSLNMFSHQHDLLDQPESQATRDDRVQSNHGKFISHKTSISVGLQPRNLKVTTPNSGKGTLRSQAGQRKKNPLDSVNYIAQVPKSSAGESQKQMVNKEVSSKNSQIVDLLSSQYKSAISKKSRADKTKKPLSLGAGDINNRTVTTPSTHHNAQLTLAQTLVPLSNDRLNSPLTQQVISPIDINKQLRGSSLNPPERKKISAKYMTQSMLQSRPPPHPSHPKTSLKVVQTEAQHFSSLAIKGRKKEISTYTHVSPKSGLARYYIK